MFDRNKDEAAVLQAIRFFGNLPRQDVNKYLKFLDYYFNLRYKKVKSEKGRGPVLSAIGIVSNDLDSILRLRKGEKFSEGKIPFGEEVKTFGEALGAFFSICEYRLEEIKNEEDEGWLLGEVEEISRILRELGIDVRFIKNRLNKIETRLQPPQKRLLALISKIL